MSNRIITISDHPVELTAKQLARLMGSFRQGAASECWPWTGYVDPSSGYARFGIGRAVKTTAHRVVYQVLTGHRLGSSDVLDHTCHNAAAHAGACPGGPCLHRRCVNPNHLVATSQCVNQHASPFTISAVNLAKSCCPRGHEYDEANTLRKKNGAGRGCRQCGRDAIRAAYVPHPRRPDIETHCANGHEYTGATTVTWVDGDRLRRRCKVCELARTARRAEARRLAS